MRGRIASSKNAPEWAKPLVSYRVIVDLISATTTKTGLTVRWELGPILYPKCIVVSDAEMMAINLVRNELHTEWNYMIQPTDRAVDSWRGPNPINGQRSCGGNDEIGRLALAGCAGIGIGLGGQCSIPLFDRKRPPGSARPPCGASRKHSACGQLGLVDLHPVTGRNPMKGGVPQMGPKILRHADIEVRIVLAPD
jgi:Rhodopirellula transposase DDE domain